MIAAVADTHAALWHLYDDTRLSIPARTFMDAASDARQQIAISTISLAELVYLIEKGRIPAPAYRDLFEALADPDHAFTEAVFTASVVECMWRVSRADVPDMPDRMIAATATYLDVPLISRDRHIRSANLRTIW